MNFKPKKNSCATCGEIAGAFTCRGCSENFCIDHANEHRDVLEKQMHQIIATHNQLKTDIVDQTTEQFCHLFLQQIERWEQQSIEKIRQVAKETRQQVLTTVRHRTDNLKEKITQLTQQLNKARQDRDYFETELRDWSEKLQKLQRSFTDQQKIQIYQDRNPIPFISKISFSDLSNENITQPISNKPYGNHYQDINQDPLEQYTEKGEYSSGVHSLRYKIEQYGPTNSILLGIISKMGCEDTNPYENPTFYGWGDKNLVYRGGDIQNNYHGYKTDIQPDDIFMLNIDCDRDTISLTNERTYRKHVLEVDIMKCPYPWQTNVRFLARPE